MQVMAGGYGNKFLSIPLGGSAGFVGTVVETYYGSQCEAGTSMVRRDYPNGLAARADSQSAVSPDDSVINSHKKVFFKGEWTSANPPSVGMMPGDLYRYKNGISSSISGVFDNDYFYYSAVNGWQEYFGAITIGAEGRVYYNSYSATLFLAE
jgi:hypothetical protein